jgi:hypothetical protein
MNPRQEALDLITDRLRELSPKDRQLYRHAAKQMVAREDASDVELRTANVVLSCLRVAERG